MKQIDRFKKKQAKLKEDILALLDCFTIGSVAKSLSMSGYNLTANMEEKKRPFMC